MAIRQLILLNAFFLYCIPGLSVSQEVSSEYQEGLVTEFDGAEEIETCGSGRLQSRTLDCDDCVEYLGKGELIGGFEEIDWDDVLVEGTVEPPDY